MYIVYYTHYRLDHIKLTVSTYLVRKRNNDCEMNRKTEIDRETEREMRRGRVRDRDSLRRWFTESKQ